MSAIMPLDFEWDGEAMVPANSKRADQQYVIGEHYRLAPYEDRSLNSHNHFFAALSESYKNLPEKIAANFMSFDHFRKWCLIRTGFCDEFKAVLASHKEAVAFAAFMAQKDTFAVVNIDGPVVTVLTAKSQSRAAMGSQEFTASKQAVLEYAASLIGVSADDLRQNAEKAA